MGEQSTEGPGEAGGSGAVGQPVQAVLASMAGLDDADVAAHVAVFEAAHEQLRRALDVRPEG